jgi:hypothetical protein
VQAACLLQAIIAAGSRSYFQSRADGPVSEIRRILYAATPQADW